MSCPFLSGVGLSLFSNVVIGYHDPRVLMLNQRAHVVKRARIQTCRFSTSSGVQANRLAPPLLTASISSSDHCVRQNLLGSSFRSKYSPSLGATGPNDWPAWPPMAPYVIAPEVAAANEVEETGPFPLDPSGPCCWALDR